MLFRSDLAYRDDAGFFYFAGRTADWIRVDGENFAGAPVERILMRHPDVILAAVYGVPDVEIGDRVMAAVQLLPGSTFDPDAFARFLAEQSDLGPKWVPTYVQIVDEFPMTQTNKVVKRELVKRRWHDSETDPRAELWYRPSKELRFERLDSAAAADVRARFAARGRESLLD